MVGWNGEATRLTIGDQARVAYPTIVEAFLAHHVSSLGVSSVAHKEDLLGSGRQEELALFHDFETEHPGLIRSR